MSRAGSTAPSVHTLRTVIRGRAKDSGASGREGGGVRVFDMLPSRSPHKVLNKNRVVTEQTADLCIPQYVFL